CGCFAPGGAPSRTFFNGDDPVNFNIVKPLQQAAGPANLKEIDLCGGTKAKMEAQVVVGIITGSAADLVSQDAKAKSDRDLRPYAIAIRFASHRLDAQPVIRIGAAVDQEARPGFHIRDYGRQVAVVPEVADGKPSSGCGGCNSWSGDSGNVLEGALAGVVIQQARFLVIGAQFVCVHFRINVSIHLEQVGPAVIIEIEKHCSPAEILRVDA